MADKRQRQQHIREILARNEIHSQDQLQDLLSAEGIRTTQATLSRDMRDLGAVKGSGGYTLPNTAARSHSEMGDLQRLLRVAMISVQRGGTLVVLRTSPGQAHALAAEIDKARLRQIIGTIADHDTVLAATQSAGQAREVTRVLEQLAGLQ